MNVDSLIDELSFTTSRSGGSGGQHVNKVETKVTLFFDLVNSKALSEKERQLLLNNLANKINKQGVLILSSEKSRSQLANKEKVITKFKLLLKKATQKKKKRIPTKPSKAAVESKRKKKKIRAEIKRMRKSPREEY